MNNFLLKFKNSLKSVKNILKINPHKHWRILLRIFFILVLLLIIFSLYLLYKIKTDQIFQVKVNQVDSQSLLKSDVLKRITDSRAKRAVIEESIKNNPYPYGDPSQ